jgi:hypothetical protein
MLSRSPEEEARYIETIYNKDKDADDPSRFDVFFPRLNVIYRTKGAANRGNKALVSNMLFICARRNDLHQYKLYRPQLRFYNVRIVDGQQCYLYVPERQMRDFIQIATAAEREIKYFTLHEGVFRHGDRVRIIGGVRPDAPDAKQPLEGIEGVLEKVNKNSVVVHVAVDGVGTIETWTINPKYIEFLEFSSRKSTHSIAYEELEHFNENGQQALLHFLKDELTDSDRASCQIFLQRMQHAKTWTSLMQHKLRVNLLICSYILQDDDALSRYTKICADALPTIKAHQLRAYTSLVLYLITHNPDYKERAKNLIDSWTDTRQLSSKQQYLIELLSVLP